MPGPESYLRILLLFLSCIRQWLEIMCSYIDTGWIFTELDRGDTEFWVNMKGFQLFISWNNSRFTKNSKYNSEIFHDYVLILFFCLCHFSEQLSFRMSNFNNNNFFLWNSSSNLWNISSNPSKNIDESAWNSSSNQWNSSLNSYKNIYEHDKQSYLEGDSIKNIDTRPPISCHVSPIGQI